ncbi:MAG: CRISPR-associated endonuclease Cas1 [Methanomicrobiales archaeon]|nr:CRISPR-associated endonuclease Cas1 [Methanomicrobiales archaeon]
MKDTISVPWFTIAGRGTHIKATQTDLIIERKNEVQRIPVPKVGHLLVVGIHNLNTSAIIQLLKAGSAITFFDLDSTPLGYLYPYGYQVDDEVRTAQDRVTTHRYAVLFAKSAIKARLLFLQGLAEQHAWDLFYEGELEFLHKAHDEVEFLIRMEEVRRLHKLASDMYYEILSRQIPPGLAYRRRTERPHRDPVNAMLSFGYAILHGICLRSVAGAHLDPDRGLLNEGRGGLVQDLIDPLKSRMVDEPLFTIAHEGIPAEDYDIGGTRCYLSEDLIQRIVSVLQQTIGQDVIDNQVAAFRRSLLYNEEFHY